jgi:hypothetical protein
MAALIDWFTLLFFSGCALASSGWSGSPCRPACRPSQQPTWPSWRRGSAHRSRWLALAVALAHRCAWCLAGVVARGAQPRRHLEKPGAARQRGRPVLAAADDPVAAAAGLRAQLRPPGEPTRTRTGQPAPGCVEVHGLSRAQVAALQYHGQLTLRLQRGQQDHRLPLAGGGRQRSHGQRPKIWLNMLTSGHGKPPSVAPADRKEFMLAVPESSIARLMSELRPPYAATPCTVLTGQLAVMAFGVTDTIVAGRHSSEASLAALSVGSAIFISVYVALMGDACRRLCPSGPSCSAARATPVPSENRCARHFTCVLWHRQWACSSCCRPVRCCAGPRCRPALQHRCGPIPGGAGPGAAARAALSHLQHTEPEPLVARNW